MGSSISLLVVNGPNLSHLGIREPHIYGNQSLDTLPSLITQLMGKKAGAIHLDFFQSNSEGALIDRLELAREQKIDGIVLNAGAYTHTSLALADCLAWINIPCVEVHCSNILQREAIRHTSLIAPYCIGVIAGFGISSYALAVQALANYCKLA